MEEWMTESGVGRKRETFGKSAACIQWFNATFRRALALPVQRARGDSSLQQGSAIARKKVVLIAGMYQPESLRAAVPEGESHSGR